MKCRVCDAPAVGPLNVCAPCFDVWVDSPEASEPFVSLIDRYRNQFEAWVDRARRER